MNIRKLVGTTVSAGLFAGTLCMAADDLEQGFRNPPDSAKPQTWWHWVNNNVTRMGITADLEAMKRAGLGGAQIFNVDCGIPNGPVTCTSPEWYALVQHAVKEANRLGIELGLQNCPGWSSSGGPWITPELAQQTVVTSEQTVQGPLRFTAVLPRPPTYANYYRDIAVLAFPTPRGESARIQDRAPKITSNTPDFDAAALIDGKPETDVTMKLPPEPQQPYVQLEFAEPYPVRTFTITGAFNKPFELQASDDGQTFKTVGKYHGYYDIMALRRGAYVAGAEAVKARFYRVEFQRETPLHITELNLSDRLRVEKYESKSIVWRVLGSFVASEGQVPADSVAPLAGQTASGFVVPRNETIDLTRKMASDGRLEWEVPAGQWTLLRIGHTTARAENKPAPVGGRGFECDKLSKAAAEAHWAGMMQKIIDAAGPLTGKALVGVTIDSWEVGVPNWTAAFPEEFRRRRGYDLRPFLPIFSNRIVESPEITERFLWDFRRTIADLFTENYYGHLATMARRCGLQLAAECYGNGPFDDLAGAGMADIPMGEFWTDGAPASTCKYASSSAHTYGRKVVGAESFTSCSKWQDHPFQFKSVGDMIYCKGVNRFLFHRYAMQPWTDLFPGMTMGPWGSQFERSNTWWEPGQAWFRYLSRCQFLLQEGHFVADLCLLGNEDYLAGLVDIPAKPGLPAGYDYDLCSRDMLLTGMQVEDRFFVLPSGMRYRFLVLPNSKALTLPVVNKVRELVAAGGTVMGPKPQFSPTLENYPACETQLRKLADEVWGPCDGQTVTEHRYGKGRIIWGQPYTTIFASAQLPPDFAVKKTSAYTQFNAIHRQSEQADWYFVANAIKVEVETVCAFRVTGKRPEFWDPDTGKMEPAAEYWADNGQTFLPMHFDPCGSVFVVFRERSQESESKIQRGTAKAPELKPIQELTGPWEVSFDLKWFYGSDGRRVASNECKAVFEKLDDWSQRPEDAVKYFSGTAIYSKVFDVGSDLCSLKSVVLDLGRVEVIAEVELNGKNLGILWKPPFRVDITEAVKPGEKNTLRVKVTNLWPNRLIGDEHLPSDCAYLPSGALKAFPDWLTKNLPRTSGRRTFSTWRHWKAEDPLLPSGLLGPVRLAQASVTTIPVK